MQIPKMRAMFIEELGFDNNQMVYNVPGGDLLVAHGAALYAADYVSKQSPVTIGFISE